MFNILSRAPVWAGIALLCLLSPSLPVGAAEPAYDVRVVIDVSGSMKKNDPGNLRVPAVKLLTGLLPPDARAGVWTFGQSVNMLVPLKPVTPQWQAQANSLADQIDYRGQFTHIGLALSKVSEGWDKPAPATQRHILLLTDGVVDISKDADANKAERERVLNEVLPAVQATGAKIHSIALSADADAALMQRLSQTTDGIHEVVDSADELHRVFLRLFEQAAPRPTVPLNDNRFKVDASIDEFTLLVMRKDKTAATALIDPAGKKAAKDAHPSGWRWFRDDRYDLITVPKPQAGDWQVEAAVDPDNRVMVVSKLGMKLNTLPTQVLAGEFVPLRVDLLEDGAVITRDDFLSLVKVQLRVGADDVMDFARVGAQFQLNWPVPPLSGRQELMVEVTAPTFHRQQRVAIQITAQALTAELAAVADHPAQRQLRIAIDTALFKPGSVQLRATHQIPKAEAPAAVELIADENRWSAVLADETPGEHLISVEAEAQSLSGRKVKMSADTLRWRVADAAAAATPAAAEPQAQDKAAAEPVAEAAEDAPAETAPKPGLSFWWWAAIINGVLVTIAGAVWWWMRRRHRKAKSMIDEAFGESPTGEEKAAPARDKKA